MAQFSHWLIHIHNWLHWWGPAILALYTGVIPWVMMYPSRYVDMGTSSTLAPEKYEDLGPNKTHKWLAWWSVPVWYLLWWAMPHAGVEILLMCLVVPLFLIYFFFAVGMHVMDWFFHTFDDEKAKRKALGLSLTEWEVMKYRKKQAEEQAQMKAFEEREASFRGEDIRKDRFRVHDGRGERK